jgi:oligopeptide/dipeptide ABC transporter ATP-binding protein
MVRFEDYQPVDFPADGFGGKKVTYVDELQFIPISDEAVRLTSVEGGEYDFADFVPVDEYIRLKDHPTIQALPSVPRAWFAFQFNKRAGVMSDVKIREAFLTALDMGPILASGYGDEAFWRLDPSIMLKEQIWWSDVGKEKYNKDIVGDSLIIHHMVKNKLEVEKRVKELLEIVGLSSKSIDRYPHEFSGGQRKRIDIARALALNPKFIICDEPVSALDVSIQAQIIHLLEDLQKEFELTYLFIAHNLSVVKNISDRVAVMYLGKIVELAPVTELYNYPKHPDTEALMAAVPIPDPTIRRHVILLKGDIPSSINPPNGCSFHIRCQYAKKICSQEEPELVDINNNKHYVACHLAKKYTI